ncbi:MAG: DHH family phosphoesterase [Candidatus Riflebacteria bacterium]
MEEAVILQTEFNNVEDYSSQWDKLRKANPGLEKILEVIEKPQGTALVFSHDDPDGITSGLIFKRILQKKGWKVSCNFPEGFMLQPAQLKQAIDQTPDASSIFLLDKGTLAPYNDYAANLPVYIVDHHPTPVAPEKCTYFNPSLPAYTWCSTSILAHGIATMAGTRDKFDDFLCMVGLKGDWAIEPVKGILADFARPFFVKYGQQFKNLLKLVKERPTQFDAEQRDHTCLLSRVTEFVHATGGGGFSYFYHDRDASLKNVDHAACIAAGLEGLADKIEKIAAITSLDQFVNLIAEPNQANLQKIFTYFLQDWESANRILDSSVKALQLGETSIYLFVGPKVPLLPMIGSIKLFEMKQKAGEKLAQIIMVSSVSQEYTHVSVRGTGDRVHSGKICGELQDSMQRIYAPFKDKISGGGHPKAAECTVRTAEVPFMNVLTRVVEVLGEMKSLEKLAAEKELDDSQKARADKLGLEYLKK